jgi:hypothetical protein
MTAKPSRSIWAEKELSKYCSRHTPCAEVAEFGRFALRPIRTRRWIFGSAMLSLMLLDGTRSVPATLVPHHLRIADTDDAAADSVARVAWRLLRFEIVRLGVDNKRSADD